MKLRSGKIKKTKVLSPQVIGPEPAGDGGSLQPFVQDNFDLKSVYDGDGLKQPMISDAIGSKSVEDGVDQSESLHNYDDCIFRTPDRVESTSYERVSHPSDDILDWTPDVHKYGGGDQSMETTDHFNDFRGRKLTID